jgi:hypothetical protein
MTTRFERYKAKQREPVSYIPVHEDAGIGDCVGCFLLDKLEEHRFRVIVCSEGCPGWVPVECTEDEDVSEAERKKRDNPAYLMTRFARLATALQNVRGLAGDRRVLRRLVQDVRNGAEPVFHSNVIHLELSGKETAAF